MADVTAPVTLYTSIFYFLNDKEKISVAFNKSEVTLDNEARKICRIEKTPASPYRT